MGEPHPFTIASSPGRPNLEFFVRHLGDWSLRLPETDLVGHLVTVEGPYGASEPLGDQGQPVVWIAGGVGITPFLSALDSLGLAGADVAVCGPAGLVSTMAAASARRGTAHIETEDFDLRRGFGPDRSVEIALLVDALRTGRPDRLAELKQRLFDPPDVVPAGADGVADQRGQLVER